MTSSQPPNNTAVEEGFADLRSTSPKAVEAHVGVRPATSAFATMERALLVAATHCQGGHSDAGELIAANFGIPFPLTMENLAIAAEARGYDRDDLWPWWKRMRDARDAMPDLYAGTCEDRRLVKAGYQVCGSNGDRQWHWRGPSGAWHDGFRTETGAVRAALKDLRGLSSEGDTEQPINTNGLPK